MYSTRCWGKKRYDKMVLMDLGMIYVKYMIIELITIISVIC